MLNPEALIVTEWSREITRLVQLTTDRETLPKIRTGPSGAKPADLQSDE